MTLMHPVTRGRIIAGCILRAIRFGGLSYSAVTGDRWMLNKPLEYWAVLIGMVLYAASRDAEEEEAIYRRVAIASWQS